MPKFIAIDQPVTVSYKFAFRDTTGQPYVTEKLDNLVLFFTDERVFLFANSERLIKAKPEDSAEFKRLKEKLFTTEETRQSYFIMDNYVLKYCGFEIETGTKTNVPLTNVMIGHTLWNRRTANNEGPLQYTEFGENSITFGKPKGPRHLLKIDDKYVVMSEAGLEGSPAPEPTTDINNTVPKETPEVRKISNAKKALSTINRGNSLSGWPSNEIKAAAGKNAWGEWVPQNGMVGEVVHSWEGPENKYFKSKNEIIERFKDKVVARKHLNHYRYNPAITLTFESDEIGKNVVKKIKQRLSSHFSTIANENANKITQAADAHMEDIARRMDNVLSETQKQQEEAKFIDDNPEFVCPITQHVMTDPVVFRDGFSYERKDIENWINIQKKQHGYVGKVKSPVTGEFVVPSFHTNFVLKQIIERQKNSATSQHS